MDPSSFTPGADDPLPHSPAAERNADPILEVLRDRLPANGRVLEIASGTGQHAVHFARNLPGLSWQPSDTDAKALDAVRARVEQVALANLSAPITLDVCAPDWPITAADAIVCANLLHISPWEATEGLLAGAGRILPPGGLLFVYGPFRQDGRHTAESNARFDAQLQARDFRWGIRDVADVAARAAAQGLLHEETIAMPANNHVLLFCRSPDTVAAM